MVHGSFRRHKGAGADSDPRDVFSVGGRDGLSELVSGHPAYVHGLTSQFHAGEVPNDVDELAIPYGAAHLAQRRGVRRVARRFDGERALEQAVPVCPQPEHSAAQLNWIDQRSPNHISDLPRDVIRGDISSFQTEFDAVRQRSRARESLFRAGMAAGLSFEEAADLSEGRSNKRLLVLAREAKATLKERRKVLKRAAGLAQAVVGREALAGFASGTGALIMGETAGFYVRPALSLTTVGHGALDIDVLSPEREVLGKVCFFIKGTPAIDQMTAIGLHCAAGAEQDIIDIANVVSVTVSGAGHPLLMRKEKPTSAGRTFDAATGIEHTVTQEQINRRNADYVAKTGHIWRECLGIHMMGHRHLKLMEGLVAQPIALEADMGIPVVSQFEI